MPNIAIQQALISQIAPFIGNSEGSIFRGQDGNAYERINGKDVRVSNDKLRIEGFKPLPDTITVDQTTFYRDKNGNFFLVENNRYIPISQAELQKLDKEKFGGQLETRLQQEGKKLQQQQEQQQKYLFIGVGLLLVVLLLKS
jgi:hypothetical protein